MAHCVLQSVPFAVSWKTTRLLRWVFPLWYYTSRHLTAVQGLVIPEVLRPYMQGREFLPWVKDLPKGLQRKHA